VTDLYTAFEAVARTRPEALAFDCGGGERFSYSDVVAESGRLAGALAAAGVAPGDRMLVQREKDVAGVFLYLAALRAGAVYVPLNTAYTDAELDYFLADATPRLAVVSSARAAAIAALPGAANTVVTTLEALGRVDAPAAPTVNRESSDLAAILYTSGTTGRSKGAMLSHANLLANAATLIETWGFSSDDVLLHTLPIYHVHGLFVALHCALLSGAATLFEPRFEARHVLELLPSVTVFMGVPTYYTRLLNEPDFPSSDTRLRLWVSGSAPLRVETFDAFEARTGQCILERYGMTEAGMICSNPLDGERRAGTVGRPLAGVSIRVSGGDGGPSGPGVLEITGPNVFAGYWQNPEKTAETFTDDGYFITGDVGTIDADGVVSIVGRDKDLIISGGLNVYPKEVETALDALAGINESAVIGVAHPDFGEAVVAVVDAGCNCVDEAGVIATLKETLAGYKVPKRVMPIDALPRNAMGKVQKNVLRDRYAGLFGP
jgi:malonyl-CoA/methylmalonyl-CoA synthetase